VSWITAGRRHPAAGYAVVVLGLVLIGGIYAALASRGAPASAAAPSPSTQDIAQGKQLFGETCATCHGANAEGTPRGPGLIGVGAAAVDFQMSTGRMPARQQGAQMPENKVIYSTTQIHQIAGYIASLGGGPPIPGAEQVNPSGADVALGQQLFSTNCAACHNIVGAGGALTYGKYGPPLTVATPAQIYEAMQTGPESMPVFNDSTITPSEKRAIIRYVTQTRSEPNPGGFSLGRIGPVTEGLVAWLAGIAALVFAALWIGAKKPGHLFKKND
jgi:ubiquinol-cytochrome c reductase cytochrome c subunit